MKRRLVGATSIIGLLAVIAGIPLAVWIGARSQLPNHVPTGRDIKTLLTTQDTGQLFLGAIAVIALIAWAVFTAAVIAELATRIGCRRVRFVHGMRWSQPLAHRMIGAAALLFIAGPVLTSTAAATAAPAPPAVTQQATHQQPPLQPAARPQQKPSARANENQERGTTVEHLDAHQGDNLWEIAEHQYGDGRDYWRIAEASRGIVQPGGEHLRNPDHIEVGWHLDVPLTQPQHQPRHPGRQPASRTHDTPPTQPPRHAGPAPQQPTTQPAQVPNSRPAQVPSAPAAQQPAARPHTAPATHPATGVQRASNDDGLDEILTVRNAAGVGAILAAGVIGLIGGRRVLQQRRRRSGETIPMPTGETAELEQNLRSTADPLSIQIVDRALRTLAHHHANTATPLPLVRAARLTADQFDLYLAEPAQLPPPWTGTSDATVWTLPRDIDNLDTALLSGEQAREIAAPYPALVTLGHDEEDGHVFLDLEFLASLAVTGPEQDTRDVLAAVAVELATSQWADDLQVTLVGAYPELGDVLGTGRIRYLPAAGHILDDLGRRARHDRDALAAAGAGDLNHARTAGLASSACTPEIVLLTAPITAGQREQLQQLVDELPRVAIATITTGDADDDPVGEWCLRLSGPDSAVLEPVGLHLRPQRLDEHTYAGMLETVAIANEDPADTDLDNGARDDEAATVRRLTVTPAAPTTPSSSHGPADITISSHTTTANAGPNAAAEPAVTMDDGDGDPDTVAADQAAVAGELPDALASFVASPDAHHAIEGHGHSARTDGAEATAEGAHEAARGAMPHEAATSGQGPQTDAQDASEPPAVDGARPSHVADDVDVDVDVEEPPDTSTAVDAAVHPIPRRAPRFLILGPPELEGATGPVESNKAPRLLELGIYIALNPGCNHHRLDQAVWPNQKITDNTRNTAMSKLRRWIGANEHGLKYMPDYSGDAGYTTGPVLTEWHQWLELVPGTADQASTDNLERALALVRGRPFEGVKPMRYAYAEKIREDICSAIADAAYELARRRLIEGRWRAAEHAAVTGITVDPGREQLWRARILAAHASGNTAAAAEAVARLLAIVDGIGADLDPETDQLLEQLKNPDARCDQLAAAL